MVRMWYVYALLVMTLSAFADNLLENPSFEDPVDAENWHSDHSDGWGRWGSWMNRETGWMPCRTGECLTGYHHWELPNSDTSGIFQDVADVPVGSECMFSIYALADADTDILRIRLSLEPFGGGDPIESALIEGDEISRAIWDYLAVSGVNKTRGVRVVVEIIPSQREKKNGALKLDDAALIISK